MREFIVPVYHQETLGVVVLIESMGGMMQEKYSVAFPTCQKCNVGMLVPLSDYGQDGAAVTYKAWACINPDCGFSLRVDKGEVSYGRKIQQKN